MDIFYEDFPYENKPKEIKLSCKEQCFLAKEIGKLLRKSVIIKPIHKEEEFLSFVFLVSKPLIFPG